MNLEATRETFQRDGVALIRKALNGDGVDQLADELERYKAQIAPKFPEGHECVMYLEAGKPETLMRLNKMHEHDEYFSRFATSDPWKGLAEGLLGEQANLANVVYFNKPPRGTAPTHPSPPHQDNFYYHLDPPQLMGVWIPLEPIDAENGCLRYVVGSHRKGIRHHVGSSVYGFSQGVADYGPDDWAHETRLFAEPGDAVVHHGMTIHRADPNDSTTRSRRAIAMFYIGESAKEDEAWRDRHLKQIRREQTAMGRKATV